MRIVQVGLGPIGKAIARRVHRQLGLELAGGVDPHERLVGRDLGDVLGTGALGLAVGGDLASVLDAVRPDAILHSTGSRLPDIAPELRLAVARGISVVSTCEELAYPFHRHPELSRQLDEAARAGNAVLLGTGVNPGFVMDKLPITLMAACSSVRQVRVSRILDAALRRESFQRKIGAGLAPAEFERLRAAGRLGHVGLAESAHMLADVMGLPADRDVVETTQPVLAERRLVSEYLVVEVGQTAGVDHTAVIESDGEERVRLELQMALGAQRPRDVIVIEGSPPLEMILTAGVPGDEATAAIALNCACLLPQLAPGLRTMLDVPVRLASGGPTAAGGTARR